MLTKLDITLVDRILDFLEKAMFDESFIDVHTKDLEGLFQNLGSQVCVDQCGIACATANIKNGNLVNTLSLLDTHY